MQTVFGLLGLSATEQRPEGQNLKCHTGNDTPVGERVVDFGLLDPRQALLLSASRGDSERHVTLAPTHDADNETHKETCDGCIRKHDSEERVQMQTSGANPRGENDSEDHHEGSENFHLKIPPSLSVRC